MVNLPIRLALALFFLSLAVLPVAARPAGDDDWRVLGSWHSVANADDVRAIERHLGDLWVASAGGGVARWSADLATVRQYLGPQHGLPCNDVRDVLEWRSRLWIATCDGLAIYDPAYDRIEGLDVALASPSVTALSVDDAGRLWAASGQSWDPTALLPGKAAPGGWAGGGLAWSDNGVRWTSMGAAGGLPSTEVSDIVSWRGAVWVATMPHREWQPPTEDDDGNPVPGRWRLTGGGLARRDGERWVVYDSNVEAELSDNTKVLAADDRALWVGTWGRGVVAHDGGQWGALQDCGDESRCIQDNFVTALAISEDGAVWVGTARFNGRGTGLNVLDPRDTPTDDSDDAWSTLRVAQGLPGELVGAILPAPDAGVWLGVSEMDPDGRVHGRGLAHLLNDRQTIEIHSTTSVGDGGPAGNDITALARDPATGALWVGTSRAGVSVRGGDGQWQHHTRASTGGGLASDSVADLVVQPDGVVWVATQQTTYDARSGRWVDGGLSRFDGATWRTIAGTESGLPSNHLSALALDGRGKLWVGTGATVRGPKEHAYRGSGLAVFDTTTLAWERTYTFPRELPSNNVTDIAVDGDQVWVATAYFFYVDTRPGGAQFSTGGGVAVHDLRTGQWRQLTADDGLTVAVSQRGLGSSRALLDLRSIVVDEAGRAWVGGMAYPNATYVNDVSPDGVVDVILPDDVGNHRFVGSGAVVALARDPQDNVWAASALDGARVMVDGKWLDHADGGPDLPSGDLTAMSFAGDEVWFGTAGRGLVHLVRPGEPGPTPTPGGEPAGPGQPVIMRLAERVFLPLAYRQVDWDLQPVP